MHTNDLDKFCDSWLSSWTGNQPEKLIAFYSEDVFYSDPAFPGGIIGHEALRTYFTKLLAKYPNWKWERELLYPTDEGFNLIWKASIPHKGNLITVKGMDRVVLKDNKIVRNEVYFDARVLARN